MPERYRSATRPCRAAACLRACAAAGVLALATLPAHAQDQAPGGDAAALDPEALRLVEELASPDVTTRVEASQALLNADAASMHQLERIMIERPLRPEQHRRLLNILLYRFFTEPRAAMGIQWDPFRGQGREVVLTKTDFPGFHAGEVLRPGDRVDAVDGFRITHGSEQFPGLIIAHDPGDEVVLEIVRDGKPMTVRLRLGSFSDLSEDGRRSVPPQDAMIRGWLHRSAPYASKLPAPVIDAGLGREAWGGEPEQAEDLPPGMVRAVRVPDEREQQRIRPIAAELDDLPSITAGGEARAGRDESVFYGFGDARAHPAAMLALQENRAARIQALLVERTRMLQQVNALRAVLERQDLIDVQRRAIQAQLASMQRDLEAVTAEMRRLESGGR